VQLRADGSLAVRFEGGGPLFGSPIVTATGDFDGDHELDLAALFVAERREGQGDNSVDIFAQLQIIAGNRTTPLIGLSPPRFATYPYLFSANMDADPAEELILAEADGFRVLDFGR
jgi:hypothetical protein